MDETHKYDISKQEEEIRKRQKQINEIYEKRMDKYFQLREIMENVKNHEGELICNPLKEKKKKDYQKALDEYKEKYEEYKEEEEDCIKKIEECFSIISERKKNLLEKEKDDETKEIQDFENKRRAILVNIIGYIKNKKENEAAIKKIEEIYQQDTTTKK